MQFRIFWTPTINLTTIAVLLVTVALFSAWLSFQRVEKLSLSSYFQFSCATPNPSGNRLNVLLVSSVLAREIAEQLCRAPAVEADFSDVTVYWKPRNQLSSTDLINEHYDVIWNRHHFLVGLMPDFDDYYDTLLHYDNYSVYWLSRQSEPVMTAEYFTGKRVGLLNDSSSHTLNIIPLRSLRSLTDNYTGVYFDDPNEMFESFYRGDIDLITGGFWLPVQTGVHRTVIDDSATAATFFVRKVHSRPELRCQIISALDQLEFLWSGIQSHQNVVGECQ
jgi:hypothetical protein